MTSKSPLTPCLVLKGSAQPMVTNPAVQTIMHCVEGKQTDMGGGRTVQHDLQTNGSLLPRSTVQPSPADVGQEHFNR